MTLPSIGFDLQDLIDEGLVNVDEPSAGLPPVEPPTEPPAVATES
jgi:hypothetical protein